MCVAVSRNELGVTPDIPATHNRVQGWNYYDHDHTQLPSKDNKQETDYYQLNAYIPIKSYLLGNCCNVTLAGLFDAYFVKLKPKFKFHKDPPDVVHLVK